MRTRRIDSRGVPRPAFRFGTDRHPFHESAERPGQERIALVAAVETHLLSEQARGDADANRTPEWHIAHGISASNLPAVVRPVEHRLPLPPPALEIAWLAVLPNRRDVAGDRPPSPDLTRIVRRPAAHVIAAVPLEPAARVLRTNPALAAPRGERLRGVHAEVVEASVVMLGAELRMLRTSWPETHADSRSCTCPRTRRAGASASV